jgi:similar to stage IV sporulation protein
MPLSFHGLPVLLNRLKKRLFLVFGSLVFVSGLIVLTSFIWRIDIEGAERTDPAHILAFLEENGFAAGMLRYGIAYRDIEKLLLLEFDDLAWASLTIKGTRALIVLAETIPEPETIDFTTPTDIVAAKDAVIVYMATSAGTPLFKPGDVVRAGEVVVASRLDIGLAEEGNLAPPQYVRAQAEVWARVYYRIEFDIPLTYYEKSFTGQVQRVYSIIVGGREFKLPVRFGGNKDYIYYETTTQRRQASFGADYPLPVMRVTTAQYELVRYLRSRSIEEAQAIGEEFASIRIQEELPEGSQILEKQITFAEGERALTVSVFLITIERIDQPKIVN